MKHNYVALTFWLIVESAKRALRRPPLRKHMLSDEGLVKREGGNPNLKGISVVQALNRRYMVLPAPIRQPL